MFQQFTEGDEVGGYRIESFIARGGMAVVYRARDTRLNRPVALKVLAPELTENESFRKRFMRESQLAALIDHPHIIPIYRAGQFEDALYLAMRFVDGTDLHGLLARTGPLDLPLAVRVFDQIGSALDVAHEHHLVHRDVKPGNVLVDEGGGPGRFHLYLTDFGLTKRIASLSGLTAPGHFLGTVAYIAPEQIAGRPADARTDVYALGCVLFEALTGDRPFDRDTDAAVLFAHLHDRPPSVAAARSDLPRVVDRIVAKAMAKEPGGRYANCRELVADLRALATKTASAPLAPPLAPQTGRAAATPWPAGTDSRPTRYLARWSAPEADSAARSRVTREHPTPLPPLQPDGEPARPTVPRKPTSAQPAAAAVDRERWIGLALRVALGVLAVVAVALMFANLRS
jgi:serine/threonine protein kinase